MREDIHMWLKDTFAAVGLLSFTACAAGEPTEYAARAVEHHGADILPVEAFRRHRRVTAEAGASW